MPERGRDLVRLIWPPARQFWAIEILFEDAHLLALNKPAGLLTSPSRQHRDAPDLMTLLHDWVGAGTPMTVTRGWSYLANSHRLDYDTSGVLLLAKNKPALIALANLFGCGKIYARYAALVAGRMGQEIFSVDSKVAPDRIRPDKMRIDSKDGKQARTDFVVREKFRGYTVLECCPQTHRLHQIRVHLQSLGLSILGDKLYGGPPLLLSKLKPVYRLKGDKVERPLIGTPALHLEQLKLQHPMTGREVVIDAPWPKDLVVAVKYLRRYSIDGTETRSG